MFSLLHRITPAQLFCCWLAVAAPAHSGNAATTMPPADWDLAGAVEYAVANNPDVQVALERLNGSRAMTEVARSATSPTLSLQAGYSQTDNPMYSFGNILNQGAFDSSINFNDPGRTDDLALAAVLQYKLYDGGKRDNAIALAQSTADAAASQLAAVHQQLAFEVVRSYWHIRQAQEMVEVREAAVKAIQASLKVGKARLEVGDLLREDLLNLELQESREIENRIRAVHDLDLARRVFWNLLGIETQTARELPSDGPEQLPPTTLDFSSRHELAVAQEHVHGAEAAIDMARSGDSPQIDTFARYQYEYGTVLGESGDSWHAGVQLSYSLYNGHLTEAEIASAQARRTEATALEARLRLALDLEVQQAQISYNQALERLQVTNKMVKVAQESATLSRVRFQEGIILAMDLIDMEMRLTDARARLASARAEKRIAIANLRRATGTGQFTMENTGRGQQ